MKVKDLKEIFIKHSIPEDATLMSDSGWECNATDMKGIYYNKEKNIVVFTQYSGQHEDVYTKEKGWIALNIK